MEKKKRNIKTIILIFVLAIVLVLALFFGYRFIKKQMNSSNAKKVNTSVNNLAKEKVDYVFLEINPSILLSMKEGRVQEVTCLNDDCNKIAADINVTGKDINESIENIYKVSKEKGFDTSKGVKVQATGNIEIEEKDYITVEHITESKKDEMIKEKNVEISNTSNENYYEKLWDTLKKDKDYDKVYTCSMENNELECHIIMDTGIHYDSDYNVNTEEEAKRLENNLKNAYEKMYHTLNKFNITATDKGKVTLNGQTFNYTPVFTLNEKPYVNVITSEIIETLDPKYCEENFVESKDGKCEIVEGFMIIPLEKLNLVNPNVGLQEIMITYRRGLKEKIIQQYEISHSLD